MAHRQLPLYDVGDEPYLCLCCAAAEEKRVLLDNMQKAIESLGDNYPFELEMEG